MPTPHKVILYSKPDCHLCNDAEELLESLAGEFALNVVKVNILHDGELQARYSYAIPVIVLDNRLELAAPISEAELRAALNRR